MEENENVARFKARREAIREHLSDPNVKGVPANKVKITTYTIEQMNVHALLNQKGETILVDPAIIPDLREQKSSGEGVIFVSDINDTLHLVDLRDNKIEEDK